MKPLKSAAAILSLSIALGAGVAFAQAVMVKGEVKKIELTIEAMPRVPVSDAPATTGATPVAAPAPTPTPAPAQGPTGKQP